MKTAESILLDNHPNGFNIGFPIVHKDVRLSFWKRKMQHIVKERKVLKSPMKHDQTFLFGRLYLFDHHVNAPRYQNSKLLNVQPFLSWERQHSAHHFHHEN